MAKISLRAYNREIEGLIEAGHIDEAIGHCRQILKFYPKHIETYRLLGKAFLESQRYSDAADILQRVLSSVPDDFVAHVGMSIIREDEGNLNEAIWHMERAFEVQPANAAIQEELRRLYGRRDGVEPLKARLTRGALARMYAKGDLYQQAVAELRAALAEDPQRLDLLTLLARVSLQAGLKAEAVEAGNAVLRKLPYCLEANRVMAEVLPDTDRAAEAPGYLQRVQAMDPYSAQVGLKAPTPQQVPDVAVTVERLEWQPEKTSGRSSQPEWASSLGINIASRNEEEGLPDWLTSDSKSYEELAPTTNSPTSQDAPAWMQSTPTEAEAGNPASPAPGEAIPEWMKTAGWEPSTGAFDESASAQFEEEAEAPKTEIAGDLEQAEIPDWLKSMAPPQAEAEGSEAPQAEANLNWLDETQPYQEAEPGSGAAPASPPRDSSDWLAAEGQGAPPPESEAELPEDTGQVPEWLKGLAVDSAAPDAPFPTGEKAAPDWLSEINAPSGEAPKDLPDWLNAGASQETPSDLGPSAEEPAPEPGELPDWLRAEMPPAPSEVQAPIPLAEETQPLETSAQEEMAEEGITGAAAAEEKTEEKRVEEPGDEGLASEAEAPVEEPAAGLTQEPEPEAMASAEEPDWLLEHPSPSEGEQLEALEAAEPGEIPDWLRAEVPIDLQTPALEPSEAGLPDWLSTEPGQETPSDEGASLEEPAAERGELPDWLKGAAEEPAAEAGEIPDWLRAEAPAELRTTVPEPSETGVPDWLSAETSQETPSELSASEEAAPEPGELPDWLRAEAPPAPVETQAPVPAAEETQPLETSAQEGMAEETTAGAAAQEEAAEEIHAGAAAQEETAEEIHAGAAVFSVDQDADFAWLESLAVKQGASEALLLTPEERQEKPPAWVEEAVKEAETGAPVEEPAAGMPQEPEPEAVAPTEVPEWLLEHPSPAEVEHLEAQEAAEPGEIPDWLRAEVPTEVEPVAAAPEEVVGWDNQINPDLPSTEETQPAAAQPEPTPETPDWLRDLESAVKESKTEPSGADTVPSWLQHVEVPGSETSEPGVPEEPVTEDTVPSWLTRPEEPEAGLELGEPSGPVPPQATPEEIFDATAPAARKLEIPEEAPIEGETKPVRVKPSISAAGVTQPVQPPEAPPSGEESAAEVQPEDEMAEETSQQMPEETVFQEKTLGDMPLGAYAEAEPAWETLSGTSVPEAEVEETPFGTPAEAELFEETVVEAAAQEEIPEEAAAEVPAEAEMLEEPGAEAPAEAETAEELSAETSAVKEIAQEISAVSPAEAVTAEEAVPGAAEFALDDDAAFAWLESLAVKQGASEALLLTPEERQEKPPAWVEQAAAEAAAEVAAEAGATGAAPDEATPTEIETVEIAGAQTPVETELQPFTAFQPEEASLEVEPAAVEPVQETSTEPQPESVLPVPDWLQELGELEQASAPAPSHPEPEPQAAPGSSQPELPSWLTEAAPEPAEEMEWAPPKSALRPSAPAQPLDLNKASLGELEKLPGVGFIMAQRIVNYRDSHGDFDHLEDLANVSGFSLALLDDLKALLFIEPPKVTAKAPGEGGVPLHPGLGEAQAALSEGNLAEAIEHYNALIKARQNLPDVIRELQDVVYRSPTEVNAWQSLGDAYLRNDQIQEALDAYTRAEELLR